MKYAFYVSLVLIGLSGCSQEPVTCLHIEASPEHDGALKEVAHRIGDAVGAKVRDFSDATPEKGNVSNVFLKLEGEADATLAHLSMHPWICLYGTPGSPALKRLQELFEEELNANGLRYSIEKRQPEG